MLLSSLIARLGELSKQEKELVERVHKIYETELRFTNDKLHEANSVIKALKYKIEGIKVWPINAGTKYKK